MTRLDPLMNRACLRYAPIDEEKFAPCRRRACRRLDRAMPRRACLGIAITAAMHNRTNRGRIASPALTTRVDCGTEFVGTTEREPEVVDGKKKVLYRIQRSSGLPEYTSWLAHRGARSKQLAVAATLEKSFINYVTLSREETGLTENKLGGGGSLRSCYVIVYGPEATIPPPPQSQPACT